MKLRYATMAIAGIVLSPTPTFAAPQSVEDACWRYAQRVTPYLSDAKGSLHHQLHSRLDGWNAAAPWPQNLLPQQIRHT